MRLSVRNAHANQTLFGISVPGDLQDVHASTVSEQECHRLHAYSEWTSVAVKVPGVGHDGAPPVCKSLRRVGSVAG